MPEKKVTKVQEKPKHVRKYNPNPKK
jgi:hypothetical protein